MIFKSTTLKDKTGKEIELRNAAVEDAEALIEYLKKTNSCHSSKMTNLKVIPGLLLENAGLIREAHFRKNIYFHKDENGIPKWKDTYVYAKLNDDIQLR